MEIRKASEKMSSRERVLRTFNYEKTDRVPISYFTNPTIHAKVSSLLGIPANDYESFFSAIGVDERGIHPPFKGELKFKVLEGRNVDPVYGFYTKWVPNESGGYFDFCDFPLKDADPEEIYNFHVPSPDEFDYDVCLEAIKFYRSKNLAIHIGSAGFADVINSTGRVMGMEDTLVNLHIEDEATMHYINKRSDMELGILERLLSKAKDDIDFIWLGEDLGTQRGPMISLEMYRRVLKPIHKRYVDLAKSYGKPVMFHSCGSSSWSFDDLIELGVNCVDTLQPEAKDMSPEYLISRFGKRLSYHGCISTAGPLAYGTVDDIVNYVKDTLKVMMANGGYFFSPTHAIQDNTPPENVIAMYQAAHDYGVYIN